MPYQIIRSELLIEDHGAITRRKFIHTPYAWVVDAIDDIPASSLFDEDRHKIALTSDGTVYTLLDPSVPIWIAGRAIPGARGAKGREGRRGNVGARGERGEDGPVGPRGVDGRRGRQGPMGPQGPRGFRGERGDKGPPTPPPEDYTNEPILVKPGAIWSKVGPVEDAGTCMHQANLAKNLYLVSSEMRSQMNFSHSSDRWTEDSAHGHHKILLDAHYTQGNGVFNDYERGHSRIRLLGDNYTQVNLMRIQWRVPRATDLSLADITFAGKNLQINGWDHYASANDDAYTITATYSQINPISSTTSILEDMSFTFSGEFSQIMTGHLGPSANIDLSADHHSYWIASGHSLWGDALRGCFERDDYFWSNNEDYWLGITDNL